MISAGTREKLDDEKKKRQQQQRPYYRIIDDDMIIHLKEYYKLDDHDELLKFVKEHCMKGDDNEEGLPSR